MDWRLLNFFVVLAVSSRSDAWPDSPVFDFMSPFFNDNSMMPGPFTKLLKKVEQDTPVLQPEALANNERIVHPNNPSMKVNFIHEKKPHDPFFDFLFNFGDMGDEAKKKKKKPHDKVVMSFTELLLPFQNMENEITNSLLSPSFPFGDPEVDFNNKNKLRLKKHLKRSHGIHNVSMALPHICRFILNFKSNNMKKDKASHLGKIITLEGNNKNNSKVVVNEKNQGLTNHVFFIKKPSLNQDASISTIIYSQNKVIPKENLICVRADMLKLLCPCLLGTFSILLLGILILLKKKTKPDYYVKHVEEC